MPFSQLKDSLWFWFSIVWAVTVFILSVIPAVELPSINFWEPDKLAHVVVYAILTIAVAKSLFVVTSQKNSSILRSTLLSVGYSFLMECIQYMLPTRMFDLYDILANCIGSLVGILMLELVFRLK